MPPKLMGAAFGKEPAEATAGQTQGKTVGPVQASSAAVSTARVRRRASASESAARVG